MRKYLAIFAVSATLLAATGLLLWREGFSSEPRLAWRVVDGRWTESEGITSVLTYGRGDMQVAGKDTWTNYTFSADLRYDLLFPETHYGDAGLVVRASDPAEGVDSYRGYYAGLRADDQQLVFGRADFGWHELARAHMPYPIRMGEWYHMAIDAHECTLVVTVTDPLGRTTKLPYTDQNCPVAGAVGLRSFYAQSSWRNVAVHLHP